jgi:hypothetical protein
LAIPASVAAWRSVRSWGVLPQREPGVLQVLREGLLAAFAGRVPHLAADLVQRFGGQATMWNGSRHSSAFLHRSATTLAIHSAASALTKVI